MNHGIPICSMAAGYVSKETAKVIAEEIVLNPKYAGIAYDPELVDYVKAYQENKYVYDRLFRQW